MTSSELNSFHSENNRCSRLLIRTTVDVFFSFQIPNLAKLIFFSLTCILNHQYLGIECVRKKPSQAFSGEIRARLKKTLKSFSSVEKIGSKYFSIFCLAVTN